MTSLLALLILLRALQWQRWTDPPRDREATPPEDWRTRWKQEVCFDWLREWEFQYSSLSVSRGNVTGPRSDDLWRLLLFVQNTVYVMALLFLSCSGPYHLPWSCVDRTILTATTQVSQQVCFYIHFRLELSASLQYPFESVSYCCLNQNLSVLWCTEKDSSR